MSLPFNLPAAFNPCHSHAIFQHIHIAFERETEAALGADLK